MDKEQLSAFASAARRAGAFGLMRCSSGNMSCRLDDQRILVKTSRTWMADLTEDGIAICRLADGTPLNGKKPSVEIGFHAGVLRTRRDVNVVLHFQSPAATALTCGDARNVNFFVIPEVPYYIGPIGIVPYILPGSAQLAEAVVEVMKDHDLALLTSHGQVTVGRTYEEAIQRAIFFELACEVILKGGGHVRPLSDEAARELRAAALNARGKGV